MVLDVLMLVNNLVLDVLKHVQVVVKTKQIVQTVLVVLWKLVALLHVKATVIPTV